MGYHIIIKHDKNKLEHHYVEEYYEMAELPITKTSIIYKGEKHWSPFLVKENDYYKSLADSRYRGSMIAERIFMKQALEKGLMVEVLEQNQKSFKQYYKVSKEFLHIKRGDFLIRNVRNLEIEVKCKTIYWKNRKGHFYFEKEHFEKHKTMQTHTNAPVILAVYQRNLKNEKPKEDKLFMIDMNWIEKLIYEKKAILCKRDWGYAYQIKIADCKNGFELIDYYQNLYKKP